MNPRQKAAFLSKLQADRNAALSCDCTGGDACKRRKRPCKGMVQGCNCDEPKTLRESLGLPAYDLPPPPPSYPDAPEGFPF